jgi:hypothetical protein
MTASRYLLLILAMLAIASLAGCSDDDDDPVDPGVPEDPRVATVAIAPETVTFPAIGEDEQFDATAFDQYGAVIDTVFTWQSSNEDVVVVGQDGVAIAIGLGTAEVYAMAGSATDTADVTVTLGGSAVREWIAAGSGNWEDKANWSDSQVPGAGDVAVITAAGDYTVTLGVDVDVETLVLGAGSGTQILDTNGNELQFTTGGLYVGAELMVSGNTIMQGDVAWTGGTITGTGLLEIQSGAELHAVGNPLELEVDMDNLGTISVGKGASLRVNKRMDCSSGSLVDLQGDAFLTVQNKGDFISSGTIQKSLGEAEANIIVSSVDDASFSLTGSLLVEAGSLAISGGSLSGRIYIDGAALLRQSGNTDIPSANMQGDGPLVIGGRVNLGTFENQVIDVPHLVLDSGSAPAISGVASLLINHTFVWRQGVVAELGSLNTQINSQTTFEKGIKAISGTIWNISGNVAGDSNVDISLRDGALISVEFAGRWMQSTGGTISQGSGDVGRFDVIGEFHKTEEGAFVVGTEFTCSGTLNLPAGTLTVQGNFSLFDSGLITGGGTADLTQNRRLILIDSPSAVMRGTIRPDLDGQPARMDIQGLVELASTFRLELDVVTSGDFNAESVYFLTSGQEFGGTLALNALAPAADGVDYRVVYSSVAQGEFIVTGDEQFDTIIQDGTGVVLRR